MNKKAYIASVTAMLVAVGMSSYAVVKKSDCDGGRFTSSRYVIEHVIDGDTVGVKKEGEQEERLRLLSIDAPELKDCFGEESRDALKELLEGNDVKIEKEITAVDGYGRLLRYLFIESADEKQDDVLVNYYMVRNGFAFYYSNPPDNRYRDLLISAQKDAKKEKLGMWGECEYDKSKQELENQKMREEASKPADPDCVIKGNISEKGYGMTYLIPGCDNYNSVKIDTKKGEKFFCTEEEAVEAGFRKATNCP